MGTTVQTQRTTRTYLCPTCDGYGVTNTDGRHPNDPDRYDAPCADCDESGVVVASYDDGDLRGLQPWTGERGRILERLTPAATDWFAELRDTRKACAERHVRSLPYSWAKDRTVSRVNFAFSLFDARANRIAAEVSCRESEARMLAMAQACVDQTNALRAAMGRAA